MQYATLFAVMGTAIVWLTYKNFMLSKRLQLAFLMMHKMVNQEVRVIKKEDGFDLIIKGE